MEEPEVDSDAAEGEPTPEAEPLDRPTRGLWWVAVPAALGAVVGAIVGLYCTADLAAPLWTSEQARAGMRDGAAIGLAIGTGIGALIWAFFPYKGDLPPPSEPEQTSVP